MNDEGICHLESEDLSTVVFDIGGTWFRSAAYSPAGKLVGTTRRPASSFHRHPERSIGDLQDDLLQYLVAEARRLTAEHGASSDVVVSMGAALNGNTGFVLNSGPLWGKHCRPIDLPAELRKRAPGFRWRIINDVTAALLRHVHDSGSRRQGRTALITISSGIASRVFDHSRNLVPIDPKHGMQGEIGHLVVPMSYAGVPIELPCDCGGMSHLNAFTSGRGLEALLRHIVAMPDSGYDRSCLNGVPQLPAFLDAVVAGDRWSRSVLTAACRPLANTLIVMLTHDPELDPIIFVGGVAAALGDALLESLLENLDGHGMYQITDRDPGYFRDRLQLGHLGDDSGLIGCGLLARSSTDADMVST